MWALNVYFWGIDGFRLLERHKFHICINTFLSGCDISLSHIQPNIVSCHPLSITWCVNTLSGGKKLGFYYLPCISLVHHSQPSSHATLTFSPKPPSLPVSHQQTCGPPTPTSQYALKQASVYHSANSFRGLKDFVPICFLVVHWVGMLDPGFLGKLSTIKD